MKKVKWTLLIALFLNFNLYAVDLSDSTFVDFVKFVSNTTGKNFIIDENIDNKISIILPSDFNPNNSFKILKNILKKNDMFLVKVGDTYYIKKVSDEQHFYSKKLKFLLPDKIISIISKYYPSLHISKSKKTLIFKSTYKDSKDIFSLINMLDKPTKSKKIKVSLISYKDDDLAQFGMNMDIKLSRDTNSFEYKTLITDLIGSSSLLLSFKNTVLDFYLSDLKTHNLIDFKFTPTLSLYDDKITSFDITKKIPYLEGTRSIDGSNDIENNIYTYKDVGSIIRIDEVAVTDEYVYFHIKMQYEVILDNSLTPVTSKRSIDNYIKLKDNESILIAGIKSSDKTIAHKEIPLLSSIPLVGGAFKWDSETNKKESFAIIITSVTGTASKFALKGEPRLSGER